MKCLIVFVLLAICGASAGCGSQKNEPVVDSPPTTKPKPGDTRKVGIR
jgi:hypothetical protein